MLKNNLLPLAAILELIVDMGRWGMGTEVEIEFAVNLNVERGKNKEFYILQMRPMVVNTETEKINPEKHPKSDLICRSDEVLGNGIIDNIRDIIYIDSEEFDRSKSRVVAGAIGYFNSKLIKDQAPYLLVGPGRWGSLDQWLGIPVTWAKISGAAAIIENQFKDIKVLPSQGSHFFHKLTSFAKEILGTGDLIAVSDSKVGLYNPKGIDVSKLVTHKLTTGSLAGFRGAEEIDRDRVLEIETDILYPAALENSINDKNADRIKARIVSELANGPTTPNADLILFEKGVKVIPDILASSGGVIVSYFEMVQDSSSFFWDEEGVNRGLDLKISKGFRSVFNALEENRIHSRLAAMVVGVARVAEACKIRGWV